MCVQVRGEARRGHQMPGSWSYRQCKPPDMGAGDLIWVIRKSTKSSELLSHFPSPM